MGGDRRGGNPYPIGEGGISQKSNKRKKQEGVNPTPTLTGTPSEAKESGVINNKECSINWLV